MNTDFDTRLREDLRAELDSQHVPLPQRQALVERLVAASADTAGPGAASASTGRGRRHVAAAIAAAVLAGGGLSAVAAGNLNLDLVQGLFGTAADTEIVERIGRPIGAVAEDQGVRVRAEQVLGDAHNIAVVYSIERTDGRPLDLPPTAGGLLGAGFADATISARGGMPASYAGTSYFFDADPTEPSIQYVEKLMLSGDELFGKNLHVTLKDLQALPGQDAAPDAHPQTIAPGKWTLNFALNYEDASRPFNPAGNVAAMSLSPIALNVEVQGVPEGNSVDEYLNSLGPASVHLGGETVTAASPAAACDEHVCHLSFPMPQLLNPAHATSIELGGQVFRD
ncbi:DUF4179 domain-containing protein [Corynebacterium lizhenjunii]|uniref:DUF4179 domain-containing protein n=1 Tax=Corynebacterium lizhenjunii TaxID=2709394 RepID=UPI0013EE0499|nr:DUF4179 domain-containing protein [Corynebacterium lizhenjunii]